MNFNKCTIINWQTVPYKKPICYKTISKHVYLIQNDIATMGPYDSIIFNNINKS